MRCVSLAPLVGQDCPGFPRHCGHFLVAMRPREFIRGRVRVAEPGSSPGFRDQLKLIFKLLGQILDVVWRPIFDVHAEVQTHA